MTGRERTLRTFQRKPVDRIAWQPRIYYWFNGRTAMDTMPAAYKGKSMLEIYDEIGAAPRYSPEVLRISFFRMETDDTVERQTIDEENDVVRIYGTPRGEIKERVRRGEMGSGGYHTEYPVKTPDDMKVMAYILDHTDFSFDEKAFAEAEEKFGDRTVTQAYYPRSPFQRLVIGYMGLTATIWALTDYPRETEDFMKAIEAWDDRMYAVLADCPMQIFNFGENIDGYNTSPPLFEKYLIPYYRKRIAQLHEAGKFCHIHMDGSLKPILHLIAEPGFDGIEAATPLPQGDVTLEELKEALGDTILLDGIPAVLFLPQYSADEVAAFAERILEMFSPNLILGVSDELPPPGDLEKVKLISDVVKNYTP
jgi:hypothetical protein